MPIPLRLLIVEDSEDDCLLLRDELARGGYAVSYIRVETAEGMLAALTKSWDLVIADHRMPQFSSQAALKIYKEQACDIPFIVVSGCIGEESAVGAMKAGAHDYIMKDNLTRLVPAVERELREAESRRERHTVEVELEQYRRRTQQQVVEQERLHALVRMASGVANDFNTALSKIRGFTELLLTSPEKLRDEATVTDRLRMINRVSRDAAGVVRRLHEFCRPRRDTELFKIIRLNEILEQTVSATETKWRREAQARGVSIQVRMKLQPKVSVYADEAELREALTHLISNAIDAMPRGGTITFRTSADETQRCWKSATRARA